MWDLPKPEREPTSPALTGGFLSTGPLGESPCSFKGNIDPTSQLEDGEVPGGRVPRMGGFIATTFEDYTSEASVVHGGGWWTPLCQKELCPGYQRQAGALGGRQRTWFWRRIPSGKQRSLKALLSPDLERHQNPNALLMPMDMTWPAIQPIWASVGSPGQILLQLHPRHLPLPLPSSFFENQSLYQ